MAKGDKKDKPVEKSPQEYLAEYGFAMQLISSDPSLQKLMQWVQDYTKKNNGRLPTKYEFDQQTVNVDWFKRYNSDQQQAIKDSTDPRFAKDFEESLRTRAQRVRDIANQYGVPIGEEFINVAARHARMNNWTDQDILDYLSPVLETAATAGTDLRGRAGDAQTQLKKWASDNGLRLTDTQLAAFVKRGAMGEQSIDDAKAEIRKMYLKGAYPAWADYIDRGMDPSEIAAPYKAEMAALLEIDEDQIGFDDPLMQKAMQGVDDKGQPATVPLWQYKQMVRKDPRWQKTDNAYETYTNVGTELLQMFGFR